VTDHTARVTYHPRTGALRTAHRGTSVERSDESRLLDIAFTVGERGPPTVNRSLCGFLEPIGSTA
jgi:hypothetical protein